MVGDGKLLQRLGEEEVVALRAIFRKQMSDTTWQRDSSMVLAW